MSKLIIAAATLLALGACGSGNKAAGNNNAGVNAANQAAVAPATAPVAGNATAAAPKSGQAAATQAAVPGTYDWVMDVHGGSAQIIFGDGDIAEGVSLLSFSCLPGSNRTEVSWIDEQPATLRAGSASAELQPSAALPLDHPVLKGLRSGAPLTLVKNGQEQQLVAKQAGKNDVADFFDYCSKPAA